MLLLQLAGVPSLPYFVVVVDWPFVCLPALSVLARANPLLLYQAVGAVSDAVRGRLEAESEGSSSRRSLQLRKMPPRQMGGRIDARLVD